MDDVDLNLLRGELLERVAQCLDGAVHVALDNQVQFLEFSNRDAASQLFQRYRTLRTNALFTLQLLTLHRNVAGFALILEDVEFITGIRSAVKAQDGYGDRWSGLVDAGPTLVEHGLDLTAELARQNRITDAHGSAFHQQVCYVPAALIQRALDHRTDGTLAWIGFQVEHFCFQQHLFEELLDVRTILGRNLLALEFAAPLFDQHVHFRQLLADLIGIGFRSVHLVDGDDHGDACCLRVVDGFFRLWHDRVVGRHHNDRDVGDLCTTRTHRRKSFVTRRIEEGHLTALWKGHVVSTNVLGDSTRLTGDDVGIADEVQQGRFPVVNVSHDRNNRRTRRQILFAVLFNFDGLLYLSTDEVGFVAEFFCDDGDGL